MKTLSENAQRLTLLCLILTLVVGSYLPRTLSRTASRRNPKLRVKTICTINNVTVATVPVRRRLEIHPHAFLWLPPHEVCFKFITFNLIFSFVTENAWKWWFLLDCWRKFQGIWLAEVYLQWKSEFWICIILFIQKNHKNWNNHWTQTWNDK